jgi:dihydrofolate reductase
MEGGTTFHFVTDGIESALEQAFVAANGSDVRLGGGASTVQQYLRAGLVDELHVPVVPILLGGGQRLFDRTPRP